MRTKRTDDGPTCWPAGRSQRSCWLAHPLRLTSSTRRCSSRLRTRPAHAARRVVVELTTIHPLAWMAPYWLAVHGVAQPDRPTVDDAVDVLDSLGLDVQQHRWQRQLQMIGESDADQVARVARRLCVGP